MLSYLCHVLKSGYFFTRFIPEKKWVTPTFLYIFDTNNALSDPVQEFQKLIFARMSLIKEAHTYTIAVRNPL